MEFRLIGIIVNIVAIFLLSVVRWLILLCVLHEFVVVFVIVIDIVFYFVLCYCFFDNFSRREKLWCSIAIGGGILGF